MTDTRMHGSKLDLANIALSKLIYQLRQAIDVYRIIGLNVIAIKARGVGMAYFGTSQQQAHMIIAMNICKIFETEKYHELNSIPGVINLVETAGFSPEQLKIITLFGEKYGQNDPCVSPQDYLKETCRKFALAHEEPLAVLRTFRNKFAAHSEAGYELEPLGSHDTFEKLFEFANDFYGMIAKSMIVTHPAMMSATAGPSLIKMLKKLGVEDPQYHFAK